MLWRNEDLRRRYVKRWHCFDTTD